MGCSLLQGIFPTQGSNHCLLHCRRILFHLSHQGSLIFWVGGGGETQLNPQQYLSQEGEEQVHLSDFKAELWAPNLMSHCSWCVCSPAKHCAKLFTS